MTARPLLVLVHGTRFDSRARLRLRVRVVSRATRLAPFTHRAHVARACAETLAETAR